MGNNILMPSLVPFAPECRASGKLATARIWSHLRPNTALRGVTRLRRVPRVWAIKLNPIPPKWPDDTVPRHPFPIGETGSSVLGAGVTTPIWSSPESGAKTKKPRWGEPGLRKSAAAARVRFIVWCLECRHKVEPDPAEMARRYGPETPVPDWRERLACSRCGSHDTDRS
jgi:hypothetical protein